MFNVLKDKLGNILNPIIPRYEIKYQLCYKDVSPINVNYASAAGFRLSFGLAKTFTKFPTKYNKIIAIIPMGTYQINDTSFSGSLVFARKDSATIADDTNYMECNLTGWGDSNTVHRGQILVIYR